MSSYPDESKKKIVRHQRYTRVFNIIALIAVIGMTILSFGYLNKNSAQITTQDASNTSNSMSEEKIIAWFCAGALGYAAFYAIGKNIAEK